MNANTRSLLPLLVLSGAAALTCETVWLRRMALTMGSAGMAAVVTLALYMGGLGLGGIWAGRRRWHCAPRGYGILELAAACWALAFPTLLSVLHSFNETGSMGINVLVATTILLPPAFFHGASLPAASAATDSATDVASLYVANTAGAVVGTLLAAFVWMPLFGIRGTELLAAATGIAIAAQSIRISKHTRVTDPKIVSSVNNVKPEILAVAALGGASAMALEVVWARLGALLLGGSVYAFAIVLAVFLTGISFGAAWARKRGPEHLPWSLMFLGVTAIAGTIAWRVLPHGLATFWALFGSNGQWLTAAILMALAMAGAPFASGAIFTGCLQASKDCEPKAAAGSILGANTLGSVIGVVAAGVFGMPWIGIRGVVLITAVATILGATALSLPGTSNRVRWIGPLIAAGLLLCTPRWDPALYAVGLYNRLGEFVDLSPRAIERFAHDGWDLLFYQDGITASVAVGESHESGNRWLSINGKVDASTGADMPTQQLSGQLPLAFANGHNHDDTDVLVVGLASGVTAYEALESGANTLTVIELEPAVVEASALFSSVNHEVVDDARVTLVIEDARAFLARPGPQYDVIISEPSNPWISGVSNLFTQQYWDLARQRLEPDGVFCQWIQLYALPPEAVRSLVKTFTEVFPNAWLFETIPGADALLISGPSLPDQLPINPTIDPNGLQAMSFLARLNTDDNPWIEFEAPRWITRSTGPANRRLLERYAIQAEH